MEYNNYLYHYGVKGMRWGVRKSKTKTSREKSPDAQKKYEMKKASKNRRLLSDTEIKNRIERIKLEKQLKDLTDSEITPGQKFVKDVLSQSGKKVATTLVTGAALYAVKAKLSGKVDWKEAAGYLAPKPKSK